MKSVFCKSTIQSGGRVTLTSAGAPAGVYRNGDLIIWEIRNCPDEVDAAEVVRLFDKTAPISGQIFDYNQLGVGKIIKSIA